MHYLRTARARGENPEDDHRVGWVRVCMHLSVARSLPSGRVDALRVKKLDGEASHLSGEQLTRLYAVIATEDPPRYRIPDALEW